MEPYNDITWRTLVDLDINILQEARPSELPDNIILLLDHIFNVNHPILMISINTVLNIFPKGNMTNEQYKTFKGGCLYTYLECRWNGINRHAIRAIMTYEPRLKSFDIASSLLFNQNIEAVKEMEECGYVCDINLAKTLYCMILDYWENDDTDAEQRLYFTPAIDYLMSKGLDNIISHSVFDFARNYHAGIDPTSS